jgi:hypothetical protein
MSYTFSCEQERRGKTKIVEGSSLCVMKKGGNDVLNFRVYNDIHNVVTALFQKIHISRYDSEFKRELVDKLHSMHVKLLKTGGGQSLIKSLVLDIGIPTNDPSVFTLAKRSNSFNKMASVEETTNFMRNLYPETSENNFVLTPNEESRLLNSLNGPRARSRSRNRTQNKSRNRYPKARNTKSRKNKNNKKGKNEEFEPLFNFKGNNWR